MGVLQALIAAEQLERHAACRRCAYRLQKSLHRVRAESGAGTRTRAQGMRARCAGNAHARCRSGGNACEVPHSAGNAHGAACNRNNRVCYDRKKMRVLAKARNKFGQPDAASLVCEDWQ